uniref:Uncharacterized protein n=1 Tax=Knipowitschia caucasica TaxID=637954 RepID=A0AAV2KX23_KNICA
MDLAHHCDRAWILVLVLVLAPALPAVRPGLELFSEVVFEEDRFMWSQNILLHRPQTQTASASGDSVRHSSLKQDRRVCDEFCYTVRSGFHWRLHDDTSALTIELCVEHSIRNDQCAITYCALRDCTQVLSP